MREAEEEDDDKNFILIEEFLEAVKQEQLNPCLLPYERGRFDQIKQLLSEQKTNLKEYLGFEGEDEAKMSDKNFRYVIYNAEIEKVQYLLKMYLRIRIKKIQLYSFHLLKNQKDAEKLLSAVELSYLRKYGELRFAYYRDNLFKYLHKNYRNLKGMEVIFGRTEAEKKEIHLLIESKQSQIDLVGPNLDQFCLMQIIYNPNELRFGLDVPVSNLPSEQMDVIPRGMIIYGPYRLLHDKLTFHDFRLI